MAISLTIDGAQFALKKGSSTENVNEPQNTIIVFTLLHFSISFFNTMLTFSVDIRRIPLENKGFLETSSL